MSIHLVAEAVEIARCFPVLKELRPGLASVEDLLRHTEVMLAEGTEIAALEDEGEITTVACFRIRTMLVSGVTMYVDDLVTAERFRSRGYGKAMLAWLQGYARERGCTTFSLDSGTFRQEAHAFYFREGMRITSFHLESKL